MGLEREKSWENRLDIALDEFKDSLLEIFDSNQIKPTKRDENVEELFAEFLDRIKPLLKKK